MRSTESWWSGASAWFRERTERTAEAMSHAFAPPDGDRLRGTFRPTRPEDRRKLTRKFLEQLSSLETSIQSLRTAVRRGLGLMRVLATAALPLGHDEPASLPALVAFLETALDDVDPLRQNVGAMETASSQLEVAVANFRGEDVAIRERLMGGAAPGPRGPVKSSPDQQEAFDDCGLLLDSLVLLNMQVVAEFKVLLCRLELLASEYGADSGADLVGTLVLGGGGGAGGAGGGDVSLYFAQLKRWAEGLCELLRLRLPIVTMMARNVENRSARLREILEVLRSGVLQGG